MRQIFKICLITFCFCIVVFLSETLQVLAVDQSASTNVTSTAPNDLQLKIQSKSNELQAINQQLASTTKNLNETKQQRVSLQSELSKLDNNVKQLNLNIKSNQITVEKLGLEIQSLDYNISDIEASMKVKRQAIGEMLKKIQQESSASLLVAFLQTGTLSDMIQEAQSFHDLQNQLTGDIGSLQILHDQYDNKLQDVSAKKADVSVHQQTLQNQKLILQDQKTERQSLLVQTKNKESVYQQQVKDLIKRQQEIAAEIEEADLELRKNINPNLLPPSQSGILAWPVTGGRLTQGYGATAFALKAYNGKYHNGVDIAAPIGTEVMAAEAGTVINVGNQDLFCPRGAYGKFIVIKHKNGLTTLYGHLSRYIVNVGDAVVRGQVIGYEGKTGYATGPHLHFTVFATQTLPPTRGGSPEGTQPSKFCGPMPVGGDLNPLQYLAQPN